MTQPTASLREQSAWLLAAKLVGFAFSFALPLLIVRYLSQAEVGHYREAFQVITNAIIILPLGFSMSVYYYLARDAGRRGQAIFNILLFNFVVGGLACLFLFLYPESIGNIFRSDEITALAPRIGIVIWIWIFAAFLEIVAIANQEARTATIFIISAQFSKTLLMGGAVLAFGTVESFIYAAMIQGTIQAFFLLNYLRSRFPGFWKNFDRQFFWEQMRYALPFGLAGILWLAQNEIHNYFVGYKFSSADFAIYAYGCFEIPLIAMLSESVTSVLIPRMNALQQEGQTEEMVRLTVRAMQKLAFVYFPVYVFLLITANTFVITLFTHKFEASTPVFLINITLLPFSIFITDPIVRSYKELGRMFLLTRIFVLVSLVATLYYGLEHFTMTGMITTAVCAILAEKLIAETMVVRKLGLGWRDISMLKNVAKTAFASAVAGAVTYLVYSNIHVQLLNFGERFAESALSTSKIGILNFIGGGLVLAISGIVFLPTYLVLANLLGLIETGEKDAAKRFFRSIISIVRPKHAVKA